MEPNLGIIGQVKAAKASTQEMNPFVQEVLDKLTDAVSAFPLAPDEFIDVGRLPVGVNSLDMLITHLKSIKEKLANRNNRTQNQDWAVAKSGELRLYKLFVCCIHGMCGYIASGAKWTVKPEDFVKAVMVYARKSPPDNLSTSGKTLWTKTFEEGSVRTTSCMHALVFFSSRGNPAQESIAPAREEEERPAVAEVGRVDSDGEETY
jgi:hypothetical protein